jgi:hypothetical protein
MFLERNQGREKVGSSILARECQEVASFKGLNGLNTLLSWLYTRADTQRSLFRCTSVCPEKQIDTSIFGRTSTFSAYGNSKFFDSLPTAIMSEKANRYEPYPRGHRSAGRGRTNGLEVEEGQEGVGRGIRIHIIAITRNQR